jgi:hypothetical protein
VIELLMEILFERLSDRVQLGEELERRVIAKRKGIE